MNTSEQQPATAKSDSEQLQILRGIHRQLRRLTFWLAALVLILSVLGFYFICATNGYRELATAILAVAGGLLFVFAILGALYRHKLQRVHPITTHFPKPNERNA